MEQSQQYFSLAHYILPPSILDWFDLVDTQEERIEPRKDELYAFILHIYLDERDNRSDDLKEFLRPNGFTEVTCVNDFPIRARKVVLHIRRRRWLDSEGKNVIINTYPLAADGTRYSEELAAFLKDGHGYLSCYRPFFGSVLHD